MTKTERLKNLEDDEAALARFGLLAPGNLPGMPVFEQPPVELITPDDATEKTIYEEVRAVLEREGYYEPTRLAQKPRLVERATGIFYRTSTTAVAKATTGLPDLVVLPRAIGLGIMVELKRRRGGTLKPDQEISLPFGVYIVRSGMQMAWVLSRYNAMKPKRKQERQSSWEKR